MTRVRAAATASILSGLLLCNPAWSQEPAVRPEPSTAGEDAKVPVARAAFAEGIELARQARWSEALAAFERSSRLRRHAVTTYNVGFCALSLGRYTLARKALAESLEARGPDGLPELPEDLRESAASYRDEAAQSIVRVSLTVVPGTARISVDGRPLEVVADQEGKSFAVAGTRDPAAGEAVPASPIALEVDVGKHVFTLSEASRPPVAVECDVAEGASVELRAPPVPEAAPRSTPVTPAPMRDTEVTASPRPHPPNRTPAYIALGVGAAGVVVGSVSGLVALDRKAAVADLCPANSCPPGRPTDTLDAANRAAWVATGGFAVGAAGLMVGAYLFLSAGHDAPKRAAVTPLLGPGSAGVAGVF